MEELSGTRRTAAIISSNQPEAICHVSTHNQLAVHAPIVAGLSAILRRGADRARVSRSLRRVALAQGASHGPWAALHLPDRQHLARRIRSKHRRKLVAGVATDVGIVRPGTKRRMAVELDSHHSNGLAERASRNHCIRRVVATVWAIGPERSPFALPTVQLHFHGLADAAMPRMRGGDLNAPQSTSLVVRGA